MSYIRVHGINLVGTIENLSVESLTSNPSYTGEGFAWYDSVDKVLKGTVRNAENSLVIERLVDDQYLSDAQNLFESKLPVACATTEAVTLAAFPNTIDGYTLSIGDRVLVKDATPATDNGIYTVDSDNGDGTVVISRSEDADNNPGGGEVVSGIFTMVNEGTSNGGTMWILRTPNPITLGTTTLTWEQVSGVGDFVAGTGISKSGVTMSAVLDGSTLIDTGSGIGVDTSLVPTSVLTMTDVPDTFTNIGDVIRVNATADGFEFYNPKDSILEFTDAASTFGTVGYSLSVNATGDGYVYTNPASSVQAELDITQTGIGLNADGTYTSPGGTYISGATSVVNSIITLDSTLNTMFTSMNAAVYTEETTTAATTHTITHNLGTTDVFATVWVYNTSDSAYHLDAVDFSIDDGNNITVNLGVSENIKVIVRSA